MFLNANYAVRKKHQEFIRQFSCEPFINGRISKVDCLLFFAPSAILPGQFFTS